MPPRPRVGRKILIASIGVATLNYAGVSCGGSEVAPPGPGVDSGADQAADQAAADQAAADSTRGPDVIDDFPVANLVATPDVIEDRPVANLAVIPDAFDDFPVANLVAPPMDAGGDGD
jgi:hypothetical protein